eukprot:6186342-Pleurochrysis_carterae.AAC.2
MTAIRFLTPHLIFSCISPLLVLVVGITILVCYFFAIYHIRQHVVQGVAGMTSVREAALGMSWQIGLPPVWLILASRPATGYSRLCMYSMVADWSSAYSN